jgi:GNAT superfamily N-acetyltransferase
VTPAVRRAEPSEAARITELVTRSKAHWGYDAAFMAAAAEDLAITPELLARAAACFVAESDAEMLGVYVLSIEEHGPTLRDLWVEPRAIGTGVGALLFEHMRRAARERGFRRVCIVSDPHAEGFYLRMGAHRAGEVESKVQAGRMLPLLEIEP